MASPGLLARGWRAASVLVLALPAVGAALCAGATAAEADPRARLSRMHAAAFERNYQGTMVFSAGGVVSSSRVAHFGVGDQSYEKVEALDGRQQQILRHNDVVHTLWPQSGVMVVERREAVGPRGLPLDPVDPRALEQYELRVEGRERIAGREAEVFLLAPKDEWRYAQRLWADLATGLMLRADVLGPARQVLESSAFSQVEIGVRAQPEAVLQPIRQAGQWKILRAQHEVTRLDAEGWALGKPLPGFRLSSCIRRPLEATAEGAAPGEAMIQAVFSDGLTHLSLFIERYDAARPRKPMQTQFGATTTVMQRRGEHWLTAMGDVPPATLKLLLEALERRR